MEIWKPILGYVGLYEVSNLGRVRRIVEFFKAPKPPFILKLQKHNHGYLTATLHTGAVNGVRQQKTFLVHRLVMSSFIENSDLHVNHINGNKHDNSLNNLEYCTIQENNSHATKSNLVAYGSRVSGSKLTDKDILEIRHLKDGGFSIKSIASKFNVHEQNIYQIIQGKTWARVK